MWNNTLSIFYQVEQLYLAVRIIYYDTLTGGFQLQWEACTLAHTP